MHEQMATLGRRPRIPSLFSTISINNPQAFRPQGVALISPPVTRVNTPRAMPTYELLRGAATAIRNDQGPPCLERTSQKLTRTASDQPQGPQLGQHVIR